MFTNAWGSDEEVWKSFYPDLRFIPGTLGSSFYDHPERNTKRAVATTIISITPSSGSNVKTASSTPGDDRSKLASTTILKKYPKFRANSPESLAVLADMKDRYLNQGNRVSDYAFVPHILNPKRDKDKSLSDNNPELSLYPQQYDTTIPTATATATCTAAAAAATAAITNSMTPIAATAGS